MTFAIHTLGCKVNIYESEYIIDLMTSSGYLLVNFKDDADIYIINTCTVTNEADKKSRKLIHTTRKNHPHAILIIMGCYSQTKYHEIDADIIIGNNYKSNILSYITTFKKTHQKIVKISDLRVASFENMQINHFTTHTRAFIKIQDGCNSFCSYCIIPYARGGLRSKDPLEVIKEVKTLVTQGYREIVLTGIHLGKYGIERHTNLETLLRELVKIKGLFRIRLSSIELNEVTDGIIDLMKNNPIIARHLHIPLQSGSNEILSLMGRKYQSQDFIKKINQIKKSLLDIAITTDLIIGFPGETERHFNETLETLNKIKFMKIHTFPYSKRTGTLASTMMNQIDGNIKKCRVRQILTLSNQWQSEFYHLQLGKIYDGIIASYKDGEKILITTNYIPVIIDKYLDNNTIASVKITSVDGTIVKGTIIHVFKYD